MELTRKQKAKVFREAAELIENKEQNFACIAIYEIIPFGCDLDNKFSETFKSDGTTKHCWTFDYSNKGTVTLNSGPYGTQTKLGRRTRLIALELAAVMAESGDL